MAGVPGDGFEGTGWLERPLPGLSRDALGAFMEPQVTIFGVRHHGPGSARSLLRTLDQLNPQCVLMEGPPAADEILPFPARPKMRPPVAILVHDVEKPSDAVYYPFA